MSVCPNVRQNFSSWLSSEVPRLTFSKRTTVPTAMSTRHEQLKVLRRRAEFGSPFYFCEGEIFWGQDRLDFLERVLAKGTPALASSIRTD